MSIESRESNPHEEPCLKCGEETAAGSMFFSARSAARLPDGTLGYLCPECVRRLRSSGHVDEQSDMRGAEINVVGLTGGWL